MLFLAGAVAISAALALVVVGRREANRPDAPRWLRAAVLGNAVALVATTALASGVAMLMQAAMNRGDLVGAAVAVLGLVLPFVGLWLVLRVPAAEAGAEGAALPATSGGRLRRGRTDARLAGAADAPVAAQRAG